jgi:hypothetical protein
VTEQERFTAMLALKHSPLRCFVQACPLCRQYYRLVLNPTKS